jgi:hypothetical protein
MNSQTKILINQKATFSNLLLVLLLVTVTENAFASTTWYVDGLHGNDSNHCKSSLTACKTIGHAIALASSGDSIRVAAATYTENLIIGIRLNMLGAGASTTIIDGGSRSTVVSISSVSAHVTLSGLTVFNGFSRYGGGIYDTGTLTVIASTLSGNSCGAEKLPRPTLDSFSALESMRLS